MKGEAQVWSSVVNLVNNIAGAGLLSLPWAIKESSVVPGLIAMLILVFLNGLSFILLAKCCEEGGSFSYKALGTKAFGSRAGPIIQTTMLMYTAGSCISFVVLVGDFIPSVMEKFLPGSLLANRTFLLCLISAIVFIPLCFLKDLNPLRYTSAFALFCIFYTIGVVVIRFKTSGVPVAFVDPDQESWKIDSTVEWAKFKAGLFVAFPIYNVAYTAHYNAPRYYQELKDRSLSKFTTVVTCACSICFALYLACAIAGYLTFGQATPGEIFKAYTHPNDDAALLGRLLLAFSVSMTYPLAFHSMRSSLIALISQNQAEEESYMFGRKYYFLTTCMVLTTLIVGILVPDVEVVLGYKGSLFGSCIVYIFPPIMLIQLRRLNNSTVLLQSAQHNDSLEEPLLDADNESSIEDPKIVVPIKFYRKDIAFWIMAIFGVISLLLGCIMTARKQILG